MTLTIATSPNGRSTNITWTHSDFPLRPITETYATSDPMRAFYYAIQRARELGFLDVNGDARRVGAKGTSLTVTISDGVA